MMLRRKGLIWQLPIALVFIATLVSAIASIEFARERRRLDGDLRLTATAM